MKNDIIKFTIIKRRSELYHDFLNNLINHIIRYYIDYESLSEDEDIHNHYNWCFDKVCSEFILEGIYFDKNDKLRHYYYTYFYHQYYKVQDDDKFNISLDYFIKFWDNIFEVDRNVSKNITNLLIEVYKLFDKSVDTKKNILEIL
jgi:hypothetical protein